MVTEWNGSKVGPDEYESKHPQLEPIRPGSDPQALYQPRPDQRTETAVERLLPLDPFESPTPTGATINYTVTVANVGGINVFVLDGVNNPAITFVKGNTYVFDVSDGTVGDTHSPLEHPQMLLIQQELPLAVVLVMLVLQSLL